MGNQPEDVKILFIDRHVIIVNKPPGIDVHGRTATDPKSLVSRVARQLSVPHRSLHPPSRLDRPVSGIVPLVRSKIGRQSMTQQYQNRKIKRIYQALVFGIPCPEKGVWDGAIGLSSNNKQIRRIDGVRAKPAVTQYCVKKQYGEDISFIELYPQTGRTHQLRVHLSQMAKCPILGDRRYNGPSRVTSPGGSVLSIPRVMLHAVSIRFKHPDTEKILTISAPLFEDFQELEEGIRKLWSA